MRVLLTGSSGWLGRFLVPALREAGHEVIGLDVAAAVDIGVVGTSPIAHQSTASLPLPCWRRA
jgi:nucleoside-diphosphate-sugar epimerase